MASILPFDELNRFNSEIRERFGNNPLQKRDEEDIIDELLDLFLLAYAMGNSVTNDNLSSSYAPSVDEVMEVVDAKTQYHGRCQTLWNAPDVADAYVMIVDTQLDVVEGYKEYIHHDPQPAPEPTPDEE